MPKKSKRRAGSVSPSADISIHDISAVSDTKSQGVLLSDVQFQTLLQTLTLPRDPNLNVSLSSQQSSTSQLGVQGNFVKCTARFSGSPNESVDGFIDQLLTFKDCANMSDDIAFKSLPLLLTDYALLWFTGVKKNIHTWSQILDALRESFSNKLPPSEIFVQIFKQPQDTESTELFICKIRALLADLPYQLPLEAEIDIVYGLLHRKIKKRLLRSDITDFSNFSKRARAIELSLRDSNNQHTDVARGKTERVSQKSHSGPSKPRCPYCKAYGHVREDCSKLVEKQSRFQGEGGPEKGKSEKITVKQPFKCFGCGEIGVTRAKCKNCSGFQKVKDSESVRSFKHFEIASLETVDRPLLPITILGIPGTAVADSGAQTCVASQSLYQVLKEKNQTFQEFTMTFALADGKRRHEKVLQTNVNVHIQEKVISVCFTVFVETETQCTLLGTDFLGKAGIVINFPEKCWFFAEDTTRMFPFGINSSPKQSPLSHPRKKNVKAQKKKPSPVEATVEKFEPEGIQLRTNEGSSLTNHQREVFDELLTSNADVFQKGGDPTEFALHRIRTTDCEPKAVPPYPLNGPKKTFLKEEIKRLLKEGIIEECESPWSSPVVLVPKPNGSFRLCVDFRALNSVTVADTYPMPRITDLLQSATSTNFMSTIDLQQGYHQVVVAEEDRDKTCFVTPFGTFRYNRMPFGLKNAPMTFARLMDRFRTGLGDRSVYTYMDDILILSDSFEKHVDDVTAVFERLRHFKLRARREKCCFGRESIKYLGHVISREGIGPDHSKVEAISCIPHPTTTKQVASFIQTCSWYRKFIPEFADQARPLTMLLKKNAVFRFGDAQKAAFDTLKEKLISAPLLTQPDWSKPFIVRTDASNYALGGVLLQGEEKEEKPIEYASRLLTPAERNYSSVEREALAVIWCIEKFRSYLEGAEIIVASDCQPLQWLFSLKTPTGRLARWALRLQGFNLHVTYIPGRSNVVADMLSRPFCEHSVQDSCAVCYVEAEMPHLGYENFRQQQMSDPEIKKIIEALEDPESLEVRRWSERGFMMSNGVLYHFDVELEAEDPQLVVPVQCREDVMKKFHDDATAGHYGVDRTIRKISAKFYFPGLRKFVTQYVQSCPDCQRYKASNNKPAGLLQTPAPAQRFEVLSVDLFGPLPESASGNKWILVCEDRATKWVELFAMPVATAEACAKLLIEEVFLRYGTCRKLVSDNGVQFISAVMQKVTYCFGIEMPFIPLYHAEANPVERKNRDIKTMLSILVENDHHTWDEYLPSIRFALNSTYTEGTGYSPAYLQFGRELRAPHDCVYDFRKVVEAENFVPRITPYLRKLQDCLVDSHQHVIREQDRRKVQADQHRTPTTFAVGDKVLLKSHVLSDSTKARTSKFVPKRDGPYRILKKTSATTFILAPEDSQEEMGRYHSSDLTHFRDREGVQQKPVVPKKKRGRPRKHHSPTPSGQSS